MKTIRIISIILFFSSCAKKQVPYFQNNIQPNYSTRNKIADNIENIAIQNVSQNQDLASISSNAAFLKEDFPKENYNIAHEEKTILKSKIQKKERVKLKQIVKIKQPDFQDKPNYEKVSKVASTFGFITLGLILLGIVLAFFTPYAFMLVTLSFICANIALLLGLLSVKKVGKKRKAKFGIAIGLIWDILLIFFGILVATSF